MQLHPQYVANRDYHLSVGDGHQIHVQEYGASTGIAVVLCHGGPGAGLCPENCLIATYIDCASFVSSTRSTKMSRLCTPTDSMAE